MNKIYCILVILASCISVKIYVPEKEEKISISQERPEKKSARFSIVQNYQAPDYFSTSSFMIFWKSKHQNFYGTIPELIGGEIEKHPEKYLKRLKDKESYLIRVNHFHLNSDDKCTKNIVDVELDIDVFKLHTANDKPQTPDFSFKHKDEINSMVSFCTSTWSTALIFIPWIWYMPYLGYRGDREDQLNHLGRVAFGNFFEDLEKFNSTK